MSEDNLLQWPGLSLPPINLNNAPLLASFQHEKMFTRPLKIEASEILAIQADYPTVEKHYSMRRRF